MQFSVKEWRRIYDNVQQLSQLLKDSKETYNYKKRTMIPAVCELSKEVKKNIEEEINKLLHKNSLYLDSCGMKPHPPLWEYSKDPKTWPSHKSFIYGNILNKKSKSKIQHIKCKESIPRIEHEIL